MGECPGEPPDELHPQTTPLPRGEAIYRVHDSDFPALGFNPGLKGRGRFHPMYNQRGERVPTLYAALDFETALCEALFRGLPHDSVIPQSLVRSLSRSVLQTRRELTLINLYDQGLKSIGAPSTLFESPKRCYPATARWATALYPSTRIACGMIWRSRQRPRTDAMVFWQPRIPEQALQVIDRATSLASPTLLLRVKEIALRYEITIDAGQ